MRRQFASSVFFFGVFFVQALPCAAAVLVVSPGSLDFTIPEGGENPSIQVLRISNAEAGSLSWTIEEDSAWLSLNRYSGTIESGFTSLVLVTVDAVGFGAQTYNCTLTVSSAEAENSPVVIPVTLSSEPLKYSGGSGTVAEPYQIGTPEDMIEMHNTPEDYGMSFVLIDDIDLSGMIFTKALIAARWVSAPGWQGTMFTGSFNGNGHVISNLTIEGGHYSGMFGWIGAGGRVCNLGLENVVVGGTDRDSRGGIAGVNDGGVIMQCYATGSVSGSDGIGGLVGNNYKGTIMDCYAKCTVNGSRRVGGLVGRSNQGVISNCYACGLVSGSLVPGGLVGDHISGTIDNCFWDVETSSTANSEGGTGLITAEMKQEGTYLSGGWDLVGETDNGSEDVWCVADGLDYPWLSWERSVFRARP